VTTETKVEFESTEGMSDLCRTGLRNALMACADTKLMLGYHYGEWTFGPPELEAAVACCSLAQTELGHVRLLHGILKKHFGDDPDALVQRAPNAFANISFLDSAIGDWAGLVAANYVVDLAATRLVHAMRGSTFKPVRMSVEKMIDEERYHVHHGQGWFRTLANRSEESRTVTQERLRTALGTVGVWFGPEGADEDAALVDAGIQAKTNAEIYADLVSDIETTAKEVSVSVDVSTAQHGGWNPANRRTDASGPDDDILYHLRGSKNAIFKLN
jgi:ring-1,2-phenylacetyl-CoA epoxidase subunit PaaC